MLTSSPFVIGSVVLNNSMQKARTIFEDVEVAKLRLAELRRSSKKRLDTSATSSRPSQQAVLQTPNTTEEKSSLLLANITRVILEAETQLTEVKSTKSALEARRAELAEAIKEVQQRMLDLRSLPEPEDQDAPKLVLRKRPRYFETGDVAAAPASEPTRRHESSVSQPGDEDLSSVVCPFELMGTCTDPACPHMHLNR